MTPFQCIVLLATARTRDRSQYTAAYDAWRHLVHRLSGGFLRPSFGKGFFLGEELRDLVVEEVQSHLAVRASELVKVVLERLGDEAPPSDPVTALGLAETSSTLKAADAIVARYIQTSLANKAVSELRKGSYRAEQVLKLEARNGAPDDDAPRADDQISADEAITRAQAALDEAIRRVLDDAGNRVEHYAEHCADLQLLARHERSTEALVLRELGREVSAVEESMQAQLAAVKDALDQLPPSPEVEAIREHVVARDARLAVRMFARERVAIEQAGSPAGALDALELVVGELVHVSRAHVSSQDGKRVRDRIFKAHERIRIRLAAAINQLQAEGLLAAEDALFANRLITEVLKRRQKIAGQPSNRKMRGSK